MTVTSTNEDNTTAPSSRPSNSWAVYGICLLLSAIFFFLFGYNSPLYRFNTDGDYQWFMTIGHGFVAGKIPYRDLFEQKGPIVYFVTGFCCLFQNPGIVMLLIEIVSMSLFFLFAYRIANKRLNTFYSLTAVSILALAIFTSWCCIRSATAVEEFCLPIYAYFLLCWLEFLLEKRNWNWVRALCFGLCFGIIFWVKFTLFYFMLVPMLVWLVLNLRQRQYRTVITNILFMFVGVLMITVPNVVFYAAHHAFDDLFRCYFILNITAYGTTNPLLILGSFGTFFLIGPMILFFMLWGVIRFAIRHWRDNTGKFVLTAFLVHWALLVWSSSTIAYYYSGLIPYAILGVSDILVWVSTKLSLPRYRKAIYAAITAGCIVICLPFSIYTYEWGRNRDHYTPLVIADVIHEYETAHSTTATLFCYKTADFGFYNALGVIPDNYYFAQNGFTEDRFPKMYESFRNQIMEQSCDFVITKLDVWKKEEAFLSQYYQPYNDNLEANTYRYHRIHYFFYRNFYFVLLHKV